MKTNLKVTTAVCAFITLFIAAAVITSQGQEPKDEQPIKISTNLVNLPVIIGDREGHSVSGLKKEDFTILEDGVSRPIAFFADEETPVNVAIMIDTSGSTRRITGEIESAALGFIRALRPEDSAMIVSFDGQYKILSELTTDHQKLKEGVSRAKLVQFRGFSMYDAIYAVVREKFAAIQGRKAIILLTDGGEFGDRISEETLLSTISESDTVIYPIVFNPYHNFKSEDLFFKTEIKSDGQIVTKEKIVKLLDADYRKRLEFMNFLGATTGGKLFESESKDFEQAFQSIAEELKRQYLLGFYAQKPSSVGTDKPHEISVEVTPKDYVVRTKIIK